MNEGFRRGFRSPSSEDGGNVPEGLVAGPARIRQLAKAEFARARRYGYALCYALCRIDRIDSLADLYGQDARRTLMERLAQLFRARSRLTDLVGRFGDDRLLWILPHTELEGATLAAERIRRALAETEVQSGTKRIRVTLSIGVACYQDRNALFHDSILFQAERALEQAQGVGGNCVEAHPLAPPADAPDAAAERTQDDPSP
ncbi:MAG: GGDEF domain-containing protein [Planctomycetota bacterium]